MNDWYTHKNAQGQWCAADRSGEHIACADHAAALDMADRLNAEDADMALADLTQNSNPSAGDPSHDLR